MLPVNVKAAEPSRVKFLPGITGRTARVFKYQAELQVNIPPLLVATVEKKFNYPYLV